MTAEDLLDFLFQHAAEALRLESDLHEIEYLKGYGPQCRRKQEQNRYAKRVKELTATCKESAVRLQDACHEAVNA